MRFTPQSFKTLVLTLMIALSFGSEASAKGKFCNPSHEDVVLGKLSKLCIDGDVAFLNLPKDVEETPEVIIAQLCDYSRAIRSGVDTFRDEYFISCVVELREWRGF